MTTPIGGNIGGFTPTQNLLNTLQPTVSNAAPTQIKPPAATKPPAAKKPVAKKPAPPKKSKPSATSKYLAGDTTYQSQLADYNKSKADYLANYNRQTGIVNRDYSASQRALNRQGAQDRIDQQNDFAGRGILHSGVFAQALGNYNTDFNQRVQQLTSGKTDQLGDLSSQEKSFLQQLQIEQNNAREDALRRRAAKLGI